MRLFKHHIPNQAVAAVCVDLALLAGLAAASAHLMELIHGFGLDAALPQLTLTLTTFGVLGIYSMGLYGSAATGRPPQHEFARLVVGLGFAVVIADLVISLTPLPEPSSNRVFFRWTYAAKLALTFAALALPSLMTAHRLFWPLLRRTARRRVLLVGAAPDAANLSRMVQAAGGGGAIVMVVRPDGEVETVGGAAARSGPPAPPGGGSLSDIAHSFRVHEVVLTAEQGAVSMDSVMACKFSGVHVTDYLSFYERETRRVDLEAVRPDWFVFSDGFAARRFELAAKRAIDILFSLGFLIATLPVTLATALLIKLDSKGPIFYGQERVGLNGKTFTVLKFRSMRTDAEAAGPQWAAERDPRITRIGAFIRRTRIDEIPQMLNVLRGTMSLVGPRPERPVFVEKLSAEIPYYGERHRMKPGITGWAQINYPYGASVEDARAKLSYDLYYTKNFSLMLDVIIILQTARVVLWPEGVR